MRKMELHPYTAIINKKQKNESKKSRNAALTWLAQTFPQAFDNSLQIRPLKLGILADILEHAAEAEAAGISKNKLRQAVVMYARRMDYLICLKARETRIDLAGNPTEVVSEEDAENAALKIKKRIEKNAKNSRKSMNSQTATAPENKKPYSQDTKNPLPNRTNYPEQLPAFSAQKIAPSTTRATPVMVTHKASRQYDPAAVARLKEKLGIARKSDDSI